MSRRGSRGLEITVMPEYIQSEGIEGVLASLARAGATGVTTSPYVMAKADEATGAREPPADAGAGAVRLLDRPLFGACAVFVRTSPSFEADRSLYAGLLYQPAEPDALTRSDGPLVGAFIRSAKAAGLTVRLQVQAAIPPGYRVQFGGPVADDLPRLPDGRLAEGRVDRNGSLASPAIRGYLEALLRDLARAYPEADGFRIDWPEYPPYAFEALFFDFSGHAMRAAERLGYDPDRLRHDTGAARRALAHLTARDLATIGPYRLLRELLARRGLADLLRLKADLVEELLEGARAAVSADKSLVAQAFPPPWNLLSGFDFARAARIVDGIAVKLYTMHWPMMLRAYGEGVRGLNPGLDDGVLARALVDLLDTGGPEPTRLDELRYPEPDEPHPAGDAAMARKVRAAQAEAGDCPVFAIAHGYGPLADVERRARVAYDASTHGLWINRYGYLADAKLDALRTISAGAGVHRP